MAQKIILDTDIGDDIDDAIALSFAVRRPELEVLAVTTCHLCTTERGRMAAKQLRLLHAEHIPWAPGPRLPLTPADEAARRKFATRVPFEYAFVREGEEVAPPAHHDAVELQYDLICRHPGEVMLVPIGPLTNLATLFTRHPDAADKLKGIAMMGGDFPDPKREYNMACDPDASKIVLATGAPKFMGTYAVTRQVVMGQAEVEALRQSPDPACAALAEQVDLWRPHSGNKPGPVVYDVCPIMWCFRPDLFTTRRYAIDVVTDGPERGRNVEREGATLIDVSMSVDAAAALALLMGTLLGGA